MRHYTWQETDMGQPGTHLASDLSCLASCSISKTSSSGPTQERFLCLPPRTAKEGGGRQDGEEDELLFDSQSTVRPRRPPRDPKVPLQELPGSERKTSPPHSEWCEYSCAVGHISSSVCSAVISPRLLHLARPKSTHPDFTSNRQTAETYITHAAKKAQASPRLQHLCLPRLRESKLLYQHGPPESPIWPVSKAALSGSASSRVMALSTPKSLSKDYVPPREQSFL